MASARLYPVILPVDSLDVSVPFYVALLDDAGMRISPGRHYFRCGEVTLAVYSPAGDGDARTPRPNFDHVYFAVDDLEAVFARAQRLGTLSQEIGDGGLPMGEMVRRPWGERCFHLRDPCGSPLCVGDPPSIFTGKPV